MGDTSIRVSDELADELYSRKSRGESYEDVIWRIIERADGVDREAAQRAPERIAPDSAERPDVPLESADDEDDEIDTLDLPGSGETLERRRDAVRMLYEHLKEHGSASRSDFLELVDPDDVGYSSAQSFWNNCVKDRGALKQLPGVDPPVEGGHTWRYYEEARD